MAIRTQVAAGWGCKNGPRGFVKHMRMSYLALSFSSYVCVCVCLGCKSEWQRQTMAGAIWHSLNRTKVRGSRRCHKKQFTHGFWPISLAIFIRPLTAIH